MNEDCFHLGVKALIRNGKGELLLLKVNPQELTEHKGDAYWDIPGGRLHKGDTVEATLRREVEEETGITSLISLRPFRMALSPMRIPTGGGESVGLILAVYLCEIGEIPQIRLSNEHTDFGWFGPKEASRLLKFKYPQEFTDQIAGVI